MGILERSLLCLNFVYIVNTTELKSYENCPLLQIRLQVKVELTWKVNTCDS